MVQQVHKDPKVQQVQMEQTEQQVHKAPKAQQERTALTVR